MKNSEWWLLVSLILSSQHMGELTALIGAVICLVIALHSARQGN